MSHNDKYQKVSSHPHSYPQASHPGRVLEPNFSCQVGLTSAVGLEIKLSSILTARKRGRYAKFSHAQSNRVSAGLREYCTLTAWRADDKHRKV